VEDDDTSTAAVEDDVTGGDVTALTPTPETVKLQLEAAVSAL